MNLLEIGQSIARYRKTCRLPDGRRMTQGLLASMSGVSRRVISELENGTRAELGTQKLLNILSTLDLTLSVKAESPLPTLDDLQNADDDLTSVRQAPFHEPTL